MKPHSEHAKASTNRALRRRLALAAGCCVCFSAYAGTVSFAPQQPFATASGPWSVTTADINADGKPDLITANFNDTANGTSVLLNTTAVGAGTPSFAAGHGFATELNSIGVTTADINADGRPDVVVVDYGSAVVSVLLNTTANGAGTPSFATQQFFGVGPSGSEQSIAVATADINGDGKPDVVTADYAIGMFTVLINTTLANAATPNFSAPFSFITGAGTTNTKPRSVAVADINADGKPDVIVANRGENTVTVFLNTTPTNAATPTFAAQQPFAVGSNPTTVVAQDVNGDGKADLVVANFLDNTISVLRNTTVNLSTVPSFAAQQTFVAGINLQSSFFVTTGDIDGDGKPDLIVADRAPSDNMISVLINTTATNATTLSFAAQQTFAAGNLPLSVAVADVNGDGRLDLVVANEFDNTVSVLLNTTASDQIFANGFEP